MLRIRVIPELMRAATPPRYLVLDRHPAHINAVTKAYAGSCGLDLVLLSQHSPGMSPLDSNLFAMVKNACSQRWPAATGPWDSRASSFIQILSN